MRCPSFPIVEPRDWNVGEIANDQQLGCASNHSFPPFQMMPTLQDHKGHAEGEHQKGDIKKGNPNEDG
jgi:hypothetical protein